MGMPMLTQGPSAKPRTTAVPLFLGALVLLVLLAAVPLARSDAPIVVTNPDASRTVTWTFGSAQNLTLQNVDLAGGRAALPWQAESVAWTSPGQFLTNASLNVNVSFGSNGLELRSDSTNHVANGDFAAPSNWTFSSGPTGHVMATREAIPEDAMFAYNTGVDWDTFDQLNDWTWSSPPSTVGGIALDPGNKVQGHGSMDMSLVISAGATWVSALHAGIVNWSAGDHLVMWIDATDVTPPLSFNITATVGAVPRSTPAVLLSPGWNEVAVDLSPLGRPRNVGRSRTSDSASTARTCRRPRYSSTTPRWARHIS